VTTNKNHVVLHCVNPRFKQDSHSIFVLNYFVFRLEISQRAILIAILTEVSSSGCFKTPRIFKISCLIFELSRSSIHHHSVWSFRQRWSSSKDSLTNTLRINLPTEHHILLRWLHKPRSNRLTNQTAHNVNQPFQWVGKSWPWMVIPADHPLDTSGLGWVSEVMWMELFGVMAFVLFQ